MKGLFDIHTHNQDAPALSALISFSAESNRMRVDAFYSIGVHPWNIEHSYISQLKQLSCLIQDSRVLAVGECGLDALKGPSLQIQERVFRSQIELSEKYGKPLIIHQVRKSERIIALKKEYRPLQSWLIHGFRGGVEQARQLLSNGIEISFGILFNPLTLGMMPKDRLFLETDNYADISEVYDKVSDTLSVPVSELKSVVGSNSDRFLKTSLFAL